MSGFFLHKVSTSKQCGQALPVGIALIMFGALLTLVLFNTGQMASEKSRLANTADAAVYSGLIWQARALNFQAYTNRAMVANQVTIAQLVSVTSWANYGYISARNVNNTIGWIPPARPYTQAAESVIQQVENVVSLVADVAVPVIDGVNRALSESQRALYVSTFAVTPLLVDEVVAANDNRYSVDSTYAVASLGRNLREWQNFTTRYEDIDALNRKASVINRSKDKFTLDRGWSLGRLYLAPVLRVRLIKEGTTNLIYTRPETQDEEGNIIQGEGEWEWKAKDNFSLHVEKFKCSLSGCRWRNSETPIGWGAAYVENDIEPCETEIIDAEYGVEETVCPRWMKRNSRGEQLSDAEALKINGSYSGVQAYYDLRDLSQNNRDPRLNLRVEVQVQESNVKTSANIDGVGSASEPGESTRRNGVGKGAFFADDRNAAGSMASIASGEIFFERPTYRDDYKLRVDGRVREEYGSLYNPYWQVRLVPTSREERLAAWFIRAPELASASASGAVSGAQTYAQQQVEELQELESLQGYVEGQLGQLEQLVAAQEQQVQNQISAVDSQIQVVQQNILNAANAGTAEAQNYIAQQQQQLASLQQTQTQLQTELTQVSSNIESQLQDQLSVVQQQVGAVQQQISQSTEGVLDNFNVQVGSAQSLAADLQSVAALGSADLLRDYGERQLQNVIQEAVTDQVKDSLQDAATAILNRYGGDVYQAASTAYSEVSDAAQQASQQYIQPIRDQINQMQQQVNDVEDTIRAEYQSAYDAVQAEINSINNTLDEQVQNLSDDIQNQIDDLVAEKSTLRDPRAIEQLQQQIDIQTQRLSSEPQRLRQQLVDRANGLLDRQQQLFNDFDSSVTQAQSDLEGEIASLQQQLNDIENGLRGL